MKRTVRITLVVVPMFGLAALFAAAFHPVRGQDSPQPTVGERIKEKAGNAVGSIKRGAASAEEAIKEKFAQAKAGVAKMGIESRVYSRLHWDKALADSKVELSSTSPGVLVLSGTASDEKAKAKAAELTADTIGVTQVINNLNVLTTSAPAPVIRPVKP